MGKWIEYWGGAIIVIMVVIVGLSFSYGLIGLPKEFRSGIYKKITEDFVYFQEMHTEEQKDIRILGKQIDALTKRIDLLSDVEEQRVRLYLNN